MGRAARLRLVEDVALHLADDVHLARLAVELQGQHLVAVDQLHRLHLGAHAGDALGLLGAQVEGEAQAVLGDHHRHFAVFLVGFVGGVDQLHAVAMVEVAGLLVVDVVEERQVRFRVHRRRRGFGLAAAARMGGDARLGQLVDGFAAQCLELRVGHEERLRRVQLHIQRVIVGGAQLSQQTA